MADKDWDQAEGWKDEHTAATTIAIAIATTAIAANSSSEVYSLW